MRFSRPNQKRIPSRRFDNTLSKRECSRGGDFFVWFFCPLFFSTSLFHLAERKLVIFVPGIRFTSSAREYYYFHDLWYGLFRVRPYINGRGGQVAARRAPIRKENLPQIRRHFYRVLSVEFSAMAVYFLYFFLPAYLRILLWLLLAFSSVFSFWIRYYLVFFPPLRKTVSRVVVDRKRWYIAKRSSQFARLRPPFFPSKSGAGIANVFPVAKIEC